jgi:hypothetical protein
MKEILEQPDERQLESMEERIAHTPVLNLEKTTYGQLFGEMRDELPPEISDVIKFKAWWDRSQDGRRPPFKKAA